MKRVYGIIAVPENNDPQEYIKAALSKHTSGSLVDDYVMRAGNQAFLPSEPKVLFTDDGGNNYGHVKNPFPRLTSYQIGGMWAGAILPKTSDGKVPQIQPDKLYAIENNAILAKDFKNNFLPNLFIKEDGEWIAQYGSNTYEKVGREKIRLTAAMTAASPNALFVVIELSIDPIVERNSLFSFV